MEEMGGKKELNQMNLSLELSLSNSLELFECRALQRCIAWCRLYQQEEMKHKNHKIKRFCLLWEYRQIELLLLLFKQPTVLFVLLDSSILGRVLLLDVGSVM
jgi:hypothetical protein